MTETNLKQHLIEFSKNRENYVTACMTIVDDKFRFYVTKDHAVYQLIIKTIVSELEDLVDPLVYRVTFKQES